MTTFNPPLPIAIVEAGRDDPRWLTIVGGQRLAAADLVIYSPAVNLGLLVYAGAAAELRHYDGDQPTALPHEMAAAVLAAAAQGRRVVWLVPPGRAAEAAAGLAGATSPPPPLELIPGVPAHTRPPAGQPACGVLRGARVLVTRPRHQAEPLWQRLIELGAEVVLQPAIRIVPPDDWTAVDAALARLDQFDWLVFSSSNGVCGLLDRLLALGHDMRRLAGLRLAAIGPGTSQQLAQYRLRADLTPDEFRAEALAAALVAAGPHARFLLARASRGREVLAQQLDAAEAQVTQVVVYQSLDVGQPDALVQELARRGQLDWITVTSSAIARSLARLLGDDLRRSRLASISPITSATLRELGYEPAAEATQYTMEGLAEAMAGAEGLGIRD